MFKFTEATEDRFDGDGKFKFVSAEFSDLTLMSERGSYRLYFKPNSNCRGFTAIAIEFVSCEEHPWDDSTTFDELFTVTAYFDGVRHFEMKREYGNESGYLYYPEWGNLCSLFDDVKRLVSELCEE